MLLCQMGIVIIEKEFQQKKGQQIRVRVGSRGFESSRSMQVSNVGGAEDVSLSVGERRDAQSEVQPHLVPRNRRSLRRINVAIHQDLWQPRRPFLLDRLFSYHLGVFQRHVLTLGQFNHHIVVKHNFDIRFVDSKRSENFRWLNARFDGDLVNEVAQCTLHEVHCSIEMALREVRVLGWRTCELKEKAGD